MKSNYNYEELITCSKGELFGDGNPQLPMPPMLMFDKITTISSTGGKHDKGFVEAEMLLKPDLWFFKCHFLGDAVMPGCLGLDALWQLLGFFLGWSGGKGRGRALGASEIKFFSQALPESKLIKYRVDIRKMLKGRITLGVGYGSMEIDGVPAYTAKDLRVGLYSLK